MTDIPCESIRTKSDVQTIVRELFEPLKPHFSPGRTRVMPGGSRAEFSDTEAGLEGFARPLWGLAPLAAGGGSFDWWAEYRTGLVNGTDPSHPEYWGDVEDYSQRAVEMAPIGVALLLVPELLWDPLDPAEQENVVAWMAQVNDVAYLDTNWRFFRVLANMGLRAVGAPHDAPAMRVDLDRLEEFYLDNGWYADGPTEHCDYYVAWEMHVDGLIHAATMADEEPERAKRFRHRAKLFADEFRHWFAESGAALPYGRSQTYRFAQGAFWGGLALADVEALPWGQLKHLWLQHLRWWLDRPIRTDAGVLSLGYAYPTLKTTERYSSPGSPYWGMKFFLPLALPDDHPFWQATPEPLPERPERTAQSYPEMVLCRDLQRDHVFALTNGQRPDDGYDTDAKTERWYGEKYTKFAYSTDFGFGVSSSTGGLENAAPDSALVLSEEGRYFRGRAAPEDRHLTEDLLYSKWHPWSDVTVETWLLPDVPWHVRIHRLETERDLVCVEGGFGLDRRGDDGDYTEVTQEAEAWSRYPAGFSGIRNLYGNRTGENLHPDPNTNLLAQRTVVPVLRSELPARSHWLATAVVGVAGESGEDVWTAGPTVRTTETGFVVEDTSGAIRFKSSNPVRGDEH